MQRLLLFTIVGCLAVAVGAQSNVQFVPSGCTPTAVTALTVQAVNATAVSVRACLLCQCVLPLHLYVAASCTRSSTMLFGGRALLLLVQLTCMDIAAPIPRTFHAQITFGAPSNDCATQYTVLLKDLNSTSMPPITMQLPSSFPGGSPAYVTGLGTGHTYNVTVYATDNSNQGPKSSALVALPPSCLVSANPSAPLSLTTSAPTQTSLTLNWVRPAGNPCLAGYAVAAYDVTGLPQGAAGILVASTSVPSDVNAGSYSYVFQALQAGRSYNLSVQGVVNVTANTVGAAATVVASTQPNVPLCTSPPGPVTSLSVTPLSNTAANVSDEHTQWSSWQVGVCFQSNGHAALTVPEL